MSDKGLLPQLGTRDRMYGASRRPWRPRPGERGHGNPTSAMPPELVRPSPYAGETEEEWEQRIVGYVREKEMAMDKIEGLTEGRIVHFVTADGEHRPAMVVKVWSHGAVNLQVAIDGHNDYYRMQPYGGDQLPNLNTPNQLWPSHVWVTSVKYQPVTGADGQTMIVPSRTWHFIERA